ncbi:signal peptidase I [Candidatus Peregrinibacteria bacterium]|nr:signal peptidase I [Candidatus Peregrinibacteria bacterium]
MKKTTEKKSFLKESGLFVLDILYNAVIIIILVVLIRSFLISPFRVVGSSMADTLESKEFIIVNKLGYIIGKPQRQDIIVFRPPITGKYDPKFEKELTTDNQGKALLDTGNLEKEKDIFYCKIPLISGLWFCLERVEADDLVYASKEQTETPFANLEKFQKLLVTQENIATQTIAVKGDPKTNYKVSIYSKKGPEFFIKRIIGLPGDTVKISNGKVYYKEEEQAEFRELKEPYLNTQNLDHTLLQQDGQEAEYTVPKGAYFTLGDNRNFSNDSRSWTSPVDKLPTPFVDKKEISGKAALVLWPLQDLQWIKHKP